VPLSDDLAERVARLERLLEGFERSRAAAAHSPAADDPEGVTRLQDLIAMVEHRVALPGFDEGDGIAMRALLEQFRSLASDLRDRAGDVRAQIGLLDATTDRARVALERLEGPAAWREP
jgi:hypothetical protein